MSSTWEAAAIASVGRYAWVAGAAFLAGVLNAIAGGGSFFSFPALLELRLPPVNANATNTVALWPGQLTSGMAFRRELAAVRRLLIPTMIAAAIGGVAGARILLYTDQHTFMHLVPWLLMFGTLLFAASDLVRAWLERLQQRRHAAARNPGGFPWVLMPWIALVCFYVGYFGAGAGFLMMSVLSVFSDIESVHQMNALKVLATLFANGVAVITFLLARAIYWKEGLIMMGFAAAGGYFGAAYSLKLKQKYVRGFIIVGGLAISMYYFFKVY
ncbi:MAG: sulfite exporter TauE/SafE family protein [Terriglobales bacterium]